MELNIVSILLTIIYWIVWTLVALTVTFSVGYLYWKTTRDKRLIDQIPGYKDWPLVGDILHLPADPTDFMRTMMKLHAKARDKGLLKLKILETPWILLFSGAHVEKLLTSSKHIDKSHEYYPLYPWLGMGLLTSYGEAWRARRHMLTPTFHFSILKDFLDVIKEHAVQLTDKLRQEKCDTGETFDIFQPITLNTLDIICCTAMGVDVGALNDGDSEYVQALYTLRDNADSRPRQPLYGFDFIYNNTATGRKTNQCINLVHQFAYKIIRERRAMRQAGEELPTGKRRPFLDLLLECQDEQGNHLSDREIREEVDTFMFEGHDTTSSAISFTLYLLGLHEDIQRKCQFEVDQVLDSTTNLCSADLNKLTYLECCIKESMRIYPPVPVFARALEKEERFGECVVPKGTGVFIYTMSLHRDPSVFPDPEKFDPTRFSPENCLDRNPFAYVPFSAGPRNCIGQKFAMMELKIIVATLLRNFNVESVQRRDELRIKPSLIMQPVGGINVKLTSRDN